MSTSRLREEAVRLAAAGRRPRQRSSLGEWTMTLIALLFATTTIVEAYVIPTGSMESTLRVGDHLLIDKLAYAKPGPGARYLLPYQGVRHGDIVVFVYPLDVRQNYVKRVIGTPGDRIRIVNGQVYRNGRPLQEPYTQRIASFSDDYRDNFPAAPPPDLPERARQMLRDNVLNGELEVPEGNYFVLGDNRDNSLDSRYWGFVADSLVRGSPLMVYYSFDPDSAVTFDWLRRVRWHRLGERIH